MPGAVEPLPVLGKDARECGSMNACEAEYAAGFHDDVLRTEQDAVERSDSAKNERTECVLRTNGNLKEQPQKEEQRPGS